MDLDALRAFLAVAEQGSVAGAARTLALARSTLTRRLESLQEHFGVPLLLVDAQGVHLTAAGARLLDTGPSLLAAAHAVSAEVKAARPPMPDQLEIWVSVNLHTVVSATLAQALRAMHPTVRFIVRAHVDPVLQLAHRGDVAIHMGDAVPQGPWTARAIQRMPMRIVATRAYLDLAGAPESIEDLENHALLHWLSPDRPEGSLPLLGGGDLHIDAGIHTSNLQVAHDLVRQGAGIALQPLADLPGDLEVDFAPPLLDDVVGCEMLAWLVAPPGMSSRPQWSTLVETLLELATAHSASR